MRYEWDRSECDIVQDLCELKATFFSLFNGEKYCVVSVFGLNENNSLGLVY